MKHTRTFLLVDDDTDDALLFGEVLEDVNPTIRLLTATDGIKALEALSNDDDIPEIIFLDLNMPRMDGKECLAEIKADERLKDVKVIIYTTSSHSADVEQTMQMGATAFITKPSNIHDLRNILSSISSAQPGRLQQTLSRLCENPGTFIIC